MNSTDSFEVSVNALITAYNTANNTNYPPYSINPLVNINQSGLVLDKTLLPFLVLGFIIWKSGKKK